MRLRWQGAKRLAATNSPATAVALFRKTRPELLQHGLAVDAAYLTLDLARILAHDGWRKTLAVEAAAGASRFVAAGVEPEAIAALRLLALAAERHQVTPVFLRGLRRRLARHHVNGQTTHGVE